VARQPFSPLVDFKYRCNMSVHSETKLSATLREDRNTMLRGLIPNGPEVKKTVATAKPNYTELSVKSGKHIVELDKVLARG